MDANDRKQLIEFQYNVSTIDEFKTISEWLPIEFEIDNIVFENEFISYIAGTIYVLLTFLIPRLMENRTEFKLSAFASCWYFMLLTLNAIIVIGVAPHLIFVLRQQGFYESICVDRSFIGDRACAFWLIMFPYAKILELGDTILLSLQKRSVNTYVWIHHLIAMLGSWFLYPYYPSIGIWIVILISASHVPVYSFLLARNLRVPLHRFFPIILILLEMATMLTGAGYSTSVYYYIAIGRPCNIPFVIVTALSGMFMATFFICGVFFILRCRRKTGEGVLNAEKGSDAAKGLSD